MKYLYAISALGLMWWGGRMLDLDNLSRTIYGEARNQRRAGKQAVANVVMNRVGAVGKWFSGSISAVTRMDKQFSCWNKNDPNYEKIIAVDDSDPVFVECIEIATLAMQGKLEDITDGATHYHTLRVSPYWTSGDGVKVTAQLGDHIFYSGVA